MTPDVLFWFYKDFKICKARLKRLRRLNRNARIYALYGGSLSEAPKALTYISDLVDDYYVYPYEKDPQWKWRHGDQMIASWYKDRGRHLQWETLFVMQWDMLALDPLEKLFSELKSNEILLSGYRPISSVSEWWPWSNPEKSDILSFREMLKDKFGYEGELFACLFIVVCFPRVFLERYVEIGHPEVGFLEFKIPTMAHVFDIPINDNHNFQPWWAANPATRNVPLSDRILNAVGQEIPMSVVLQELSSSAGKRLFHPYSRKFPRLMENRHVAQTLLSLFRLIDRSTTSLRRVKQRIRRRL